MEMGIMGRVININMWILEHFISILRIRMLRILEVKYEDNFHILA